VTETATSEVSTDPAPDASTSFSFVAATQNAQEAASMRAEFSAESVEDGPMSGVMVADRASERVSIDFDLPALSENEAGAAGPYTMVIDLRGLTGFVSSEFFGVSEGAPPWLSLAFDEEELSVDDGFPNPLTITDDFVGAQAVSTGSEVLDGEELARFDVTVIDAGPATDEVDESESGRIGEAYEVWVTEDNEIRRIEYEFNEEGETFPMVMTLWPSSAPADIQLPAPEDVMDIDEYFGEEFSDEGWTETSAPDVGSGSGEIIPVTTEDIPATTEFVPVVIEAVPVTTVPEPGTNTVPGSPEVTPTTSVVPPEVAEVVTN
jgi:hypothetical protein